MNARGRCERGRGGAPSRRAADSPLHRFRVRRRAGTPLSARRTRPTRSASTAAPSSPASARWPGSRSGKALIVRTAWVYSATGPQLRAHHAAADGRAGRGRRGRATRSARRPGRERSRRRSGRRRHGPRSRGIHHWTDAGVASWYDFAVAIQEEALALGLLRRAVPVRPLRTEEYPHRRPGGRLTACSTRRPPGPRSACTPRALAGQPAAHAARSSRVRSLLVTGGAGFIGANFVHYWLDAAPGRPGRGARRAHLRRQPREPGAAQERDPGSRSSTGDIRSAGLGRASAPGARDHDRRALRGRVARGPLDRRAGRVRRDQRGGHPRAAEGGAQGLAGGGRGRRRSAIPPRLDRRGVRLARPGRPAVHRDDALRAQLALCREQGGVGPPGARLPPHLRAPGHHQQLLEQLRSVPVPREADPADAGERAGGQAAAGLRRRAERARLALRRGSLPGASSGCCWTGRLGETYNVGGRNEWTNIDIVRLLCRLVDEAFAGARAGARFPRAPAAAGTESARSSRS